MWSFIAEHVMYIYDSLLFHEDIINLIFFIISRYSLRQLLQKKIIIVVVGKSKLS